MNIYSNDSFIFPYIRFFNASPLGGALDFYIANTLVAAGIKYLSFTPYFKTGTGTQWVKITRAGRKDEITDRLSFTQNPGEVKLIASIGNADNTSLLPINETPIKADACEGNIRFLNISPSDESYDIYVNGIHTIADISYKEISKYIPVKAEKINIQVRCGDDEIFNICDSFKGKNQFHSFYICGLKNENPRICGIISKDAASYNGFYL